MRELPAGSKPPSPAGADTACCNSAPRKREAASRRNSLFGEPSPRASSRRSAPAESRPRAERRASASPPRTTSMRSSTRRRRCAGANIWTRHVSPRSGAPSSVRSTTSSRQAASRSRPFSSPKTAAGGSSGASISTSPKTARTRTARSPSWRPTPRRSGRRASFAISDLAMRCANMPAPARRPSCSGSWSRSAAQAKAAPG